MLQFLELPQVRDEVTVDVECLEVREVREVIVELYQVVVGNIDPLQAARVLHDAAQRGVKPAQLPDLVVAQHQRYTH